MTATVDLVLLGPQFSFTNKPDEVALFEPKLVFLNYTTTHNLSVRSKTNTVSKVAIGDVFAGEAIPAQPEGEFVFKVEGVGKIIDALFGDGPERYGLPRQQMFWVDCSGRTLLEERRAEVEKHSLIMQLSKLQSAHGGEPYLVSLAHYLRFISDIPLSEHGMQLIAPANAYMKALPQAHYLIMPFIGIGLKHEVERFKSYHGFDPSIIAL